MKIASPTGSLGEKIAAEYLRKQGYKILEQNFSKRWGEIDIIAIDQDTLVFIEVKTRTSNAFGSPLEAITPWKLKTLTRTLQFYKATHRSLPDSLRIDAVAILLSGREVESIELVKNISGY